MLPPTVLADKTMGQSLLDSLGRSLMRGHGRVAARRFLVLTACGVQVSGEARAACEAVLARLSPRERLRMQQGAQRWLTFMQRHA